MNDHSETPTVTRDAEFRKSHLDAWLLVSRDSHEDQRLYDAAGTASAMLDPPRSKEGRATMAHALLRRAESGEALGHSDEAVELYEKAIAQLESVDTAVSADFLLEAMLRVAALLGNLEREEEADIAFARILERYATSTGPQAQQAVSVARMWLESDED